MPLVASFSGVRGIYNRGMTKKVSANYAIAFRKWLKKHGHPDPLIVIGSDTRPSRELVKKAIVKVLDCDIMDVGVSSTPMTEFAVRHYKAQGGIMITASHNEPYWNGFKFLDHTGAVLPADDMAWIIKQYEKIKDKDPAVFEPERLIDRDIVECHEETTVAYYKELSGYLSPTDRQKIKAAKIKIVLDPNGGTGFLAHGFLESLGVKVHAINTDIGVFNRKVEPTTDSLIYLQPTIKQKKAHFAAGFDCDADRVEIVTSKGIISGNHMLALVAQDTVGKGKTVVVNSATSGLVAHVVKAKGGRTVETEAGEAHVIAAMDQKKALFGGEGSSSGVIIPPARCRDGIVALIMVIRSIAKRKKTVDDLVAALPKYHYIKYNTTLQGSVSAARQKLKKYFVKNGFKVSIDNKNGALKLTNKNYFVWMRPSMTEAGVVRIIVDGPDHEYTRSMMDAAKALVS